MTKQWTSARAKLCPAAQESVINSHPTRVEEKTAVCFHSFINQTPDILQQQTQKSKTDSSLGTKSNPLSGRSHSNHPQPQLFRTAELSTTHILYQKRSRLGAAMAEPIHLVAREDSHLNAGPIVSLGIGIGVAVGVIFMCCFGLCWWNRRKMRRQRAQEVAVAMQPLPYEAAQDGVSTKD